MADPAVYGVGEADDCPLPIYLSRYAVGERFFLQIFICSLVICIFMTKFQGVARFFPYLHDQFLYSSAILDTFYCLAIAQPV